MGCHHGVIRRKMGDEGFASESDNDAIDCDVRDCSMNREDRLVSIARQIIEAHGFFRQRRYWDALLCTEELIKEMAKVQTGCEMLAVAYKLLGCVQKELHDVTNAEESWMESLRLNPAQEDVKHMLAVLRGEQIEKCSAAYVEDLFDCYASKFDSHLVGQLCYGAPDLLRKAFDKALELHQPCPEEFAANTARVLDLGCGTGLSGVPFRGLASKLVGVDISTHMLAKATARGIYDELRKAEILAALGEFRSAEETFDLVVVADVLVYFGALESVFSGIAAVLAGPSSYVLLTVESTEAPDDETVTYQIGSEGRFRHSGVYIRSLAQRYGMEVVLQQCDRARADVKGSLFFVLRSTSNSIVPI